jgi:predicted dinucleotide-binding enzyme
MTIAVIGAGNMGAGLVRALVQQGVEVVLGVRDASKAAALSAELGAALRVSNPAEAVRDATVVVLALPYNAALEALAGLGDLSGKVLVDISNPVTADFQNLQLGTTSSAAEAIQAAAPGAHVVKAFNTIFAPLLAPQAREGRTLQVFVAADEAAAKAQVLALATTLGFEAVDAGALRNSRFLEPLGMMNIQFGFFLGWGPVTAPAWVRP